MLAAGPVPANRAQVLRPAQRVVGRVGAALAALLPTSSWRGTEQPNLAQSVRVGAVGSLGAELAEGGRVRFHLEGGLRAQWTYRQVLVEGQTIGARITSVRIIHSSFTRESNLYTAKL